MVVAGGSLVAIGLGTTGGNGAMAADPLAAAAPVAVPVPPCWFSIYDTARGSGRRPNAPLDGIAALLSDAKRQSRSDHG